MKTVNGRTTQYPIDDIFLKRYSPRAMSGETISKEELYTLMELFPALILSTRGRLG